MDFEVTHVFSARREDVLKVEQSRKFQDSLSDLGPLAERKVLSQKRSKDGRIARETRCVLDIEVTGMARTVLGDTKPAWVEVATWDPDSSTWEWVIHPEVASELLTAHGTMGFSESRGATTRRVAGVVKVKVPLYGGKVEGWIVQGIERTYEEEAARLSEWLERES
ncbi:MAG: DUF2505 domain-containing protein [Actinomycetota bacterium]|nr:DUF2505 domain-containing protein [Actinomycetota bacterium]